MYTYVQYIVYLISMQLCVGLWCAWGYMCAIYCVPGYKCLYAMGLWYICMSTYVQPAVYP